MAARFFGYVQGMQRLLGTEVVILNFDKTPLCPIREALLRGGSCWRDRRGGARPRILSGYKTLRDCHHMRGKCRRWEAAAAPVRHPAEPNLPPTEEMSKYPLCHVAATESGVVNGEFMKNEYATYEQILRWVQALLCSSTALVVAPETAPEPELVRTAPTQGQSGKFVCKKNAKTAFRRWALVSPAITQHTEGNLEGVFFCRGWNGL